MKQQLLLQLLFLVWLVATELAMPIAAAGGGLAVVALDGSGQYTSIQEAVEAAPADTTSYVIHIKSGKYVENVEVRRANVVMIGDGMGRTVISASVRRTETVGTPCTGTLSAQGHGFMARDMTIENTAGPGANQAVALVANSNHSVFLRCEITGYQDTLLADQYLQFYKECRISGTVDFIFGEASAVFQDCLILARRPLQGSYNTVTGQGRRSGENPSGFVFHRCNVSTEEDLTGVDTYLGRPWHPFSRVVFMMSYLDGRVVHPQGWVAWNRDNATDDDNTYRTVFYAEYQNTGAGANTSQRVRWPGFYDIRTADQVRQFTVDKFIDGSQWLPQANITYL